MNDLAIAWAVYLGADTPAKLAAEWRVTICRAYSDLARGVRSRFIFRIKNGRYVANDWALQVHP